MTISEYIFYLEKIRDNHGDLRVAKKLWDGRVTTESFLEPKVEYLLVLNKRESKSRFWSASEADAFKPGRKGEKVCHL